MQAVAEEVDATPAQVPLRWLSGQERFTCIPIVDARTPYQSRENLSVPVISLSTDQHDRITEAYFRRPSVIRRRRRNLVSMTDTTNDPDWHGTEDDRAGESGDEPAGRSAVGGPVLNLDDEPSGEDEPPPECAVDGCHREGRTAKKMPVSGASEEATDQYVCRYHRTLFLGVRALVVAVVLALFLLAYVRV